MTAGLFTIAPHVAFADALVRGLLARVGSDPLALARTWLLLPNRRAVTAVTDAFVRAMDSDGRAAGLLLPRMTPVGDIGDDGFERLVAGETMLPPPVPPLLRRFELARLVRALPREPSPVEALRLGDALAAALDALLAEEIAPERLRDVVAEANPELAAHWQATLAYLDLIITAWPQARAAHGGADAGTRLATLIDATVARWRAAPPTAPVLVAGVTGSSPPLVRLLRAVLDLPQGLVVLPGLDTDRSEDGEARWEAIRCDAADGLRDSGEHPQQAMKALLARLGRDRAEVADWGVVTPWDGPAARTPALLAALAPADAAEGWHMGAADPEAFAGVAVVEAATRAEEAQAIALALRQALEVPGRRAALVTPDRGLARRVAAHCRRWRIAIDDSAGTPLRLTPPGALLLALAGAMVEGFAPVALLAVLKHPLVEAGDGRTEWLRQVRTLDLALRGQRPPAGLEAIAEALERWLEDRLARTGDPEQREARAAAAAETMAWFEGAAARLDPLERRRERAELTLPQLAAALRETGAALAGDMLWAGPAGRMAAERLADIEAHGAIFGAIEPGDAAAMLAALFAGCDVRDPAIGHPRLAILGPIEAQLARFDLMILGGMDEGVWPGVPAPDPWLAPAIRARLGLPGTARAIGLAAQDFVRALGAPQVLLTRARRDAGGPLVPSRFWRRLAAFAGEALARRDDLIAHARAIDSAGGVPAPQPAPRPAPPAAERPRRLSVTDIDTLIADPFAYYAKAMLRLRALDPLDADPSAAMKGELIHGILERWIKAGHHDLAQLATIAGPELDAEGRHFPLLRALWLPRARRALDWAGQAVLARVGDGWTTMVAEPKGRMTLANGVLLSGRADRVDRDGEGRLAVIDYKTGAHPSGARVKALDATQLGLTMALAASGSLAGVAAGAPAEIGYWKLGGGRDPGKASNPLGKEPAADHVAAVVERALQLTGDYLLGERAFHPKLRPAWAWSDYDHLARVAEWIDRPRPRGTP